MLYIDSKYVGLVSARLPLFKRRNDTYNFRCPLCGDSQTNKNKTRGYLYRKGDGLLYYCHNCHVSVSFGNFLKAIDPEVYKQYVQEKFIEKNSNTNVAIADKPPDITSFAKPVFITNTPLKSLKKISQLAWDHPAKKYINSRMIPTRFHSKLFYAPKFKKWVNSIIPDKFDVDKLDDDEPRLIIPMIDKNHDVIGVQGRSFRKDGIRYITIIFNDQLPKVFGLDDVDFTQTTYVTEGPIDSMFIPNAIAMAGSDGINVIDSIVAEHRDNIVFVYDNEPRNKEICKIIEKAIDRGFKVAFWPDHVVSKDINDMVLKENLKPVDIKLIIDNNTYSGLQAKLKLTTWRKL